MKQMSCTHFVLFVKDVEATRHFYIDESGCVLRCFSSEEKFLSIAVRDFTINFYGVSSGLAEGYSQGLAHVGFEVETRAIVDDYAKQFQRFDSFQDKRNAAHGPYRFYVCDPDGCTLELHTWQDVKQ
jgi:catechol 2,3-dioxygenase-like lactoylglutathione lyase family enzyme